MRLAIISDIHYGEGETYGRINPESNCNTRLEDIDDAVHTYIDYIESNKIEVAIIAGDVYKTRKPTPTQQTLFARAVIRLLKIDPTILKKVIIVPGNHDIQLAETAHSLSSIGVLVSGFDSRLVVTEQPEEFVIITETEKVLISTIPYLYRQRLQMASNQQVVELYTTIIKDVIKKHSDCTSKVFIGHQTVEGVEFCEYVDVNSFNEIIVPKDILSDFDAAFFGHIHKFQVLQASNPLIINQGNPLTLNFGEMEEKGFVVYDTISKTHERVIIPGCKFLQLTVDASAPDVDATTLITAALQQADLVDAIVKIKLTAKESDLPIRVKEFASSLEKTKFFAGIDKQIQRQARVRDQRVAKDAKFESVIHALVENRKYDPEMANRYKQLANQVKFQAEGP